MRFSTVETRWFFEGPVPQTVLAWWRSEGEVAWAERTDVYRVPGPDLGIKLREGRFEVKGRTAEHGPRPLATGVEGRLESWVKWSHEDGPPMDGIAVHKRRSLRLLRRDGAPADDPAVTTGVELTEVAVAGARWWTVGLEALDDGNGDPLERLVTTAAIALRRAPPMPVERSVGYAGWLLSLDLR